MERVRVLIRMNNRTLRTLRDGIMLLYYGAGLIITVFSAHSMSDFNILSFDDVEKSVVISTTVPVLGQIPIEPLASDIAISPF